jgi:hypothetical protein
MRRKWDRQTDVSLLKEPVFPDGHYIFKDNGKVISYICIYKKNLLITIN